MPIAVTVGFAEVAVDDCGFFAEVFLEIVDGLRGESDFGDKDEGLFLLGDGGGGEAAIDFSFA